MPILPIRSVDGFDGMDFYLENWEFNRDGQHKGITDRQKDYDGRGASNGLVVSVNTVDLTRVDVSIGIGYDGDGRRLEIAANGAYNASATPTGNQGIPLADYTTNRINYVLIKFVQLLSENREDEFGVIHQIYSSESYQIIVSTTNLSSADNDYILLAQVNPNGVGIDLGVNDITATINTIKPWLTKQRHTHKATFDSAGLYDGDQVDVGGLANSSVTTVKIVDRAVTSTKIAVGAVLDEHYAGAATEGIVFDATTNPAPLLENIRRREGQMSLSFVSQAPQFHTNFNSDPDVTSGVEDTTSSFLSTGGANGGADSMLVSLSGGVPVVGKGVAYVQGKYVRIEADKLLNDASNMVSGSIAPGVGFEQNVTNSIYININGKFTMQDATNTNPPNDSLLLAAVDMGDSISSGSNLTDKRRVYPYPDQLVGVRHSSLDFMNGITGNYSQLNTVLGTLEDRKIYDAGFLTFGSFAGTVDLGVSIASWATHDFTIIPQSVAWINQTGTNGWSATGINWVPGSSLTVRLVMFGASSIAITFNILAW